MAYMEKVKCEFFSAEGQPNFLSKLRRPGLPDGIFSNQNYQFG
jgi:hypothetical protein